MTLWALLLLALPDLPTEDQWLAQAQSGQRQAVALIYEHYFDAVFRFIRWRVDDDATAEDLTSEVFIRLLDALHGTHAPAHSLRGWLFRVARNVLYDHRGQAQHTADLDESLAGPDSDLLGDLLAHDDLAQVRLALRDLAADQQDVLILRFGHMLSLEDTAERMERSVGAIKSLQFRALSTLRRRLTDVAVEAGRD